MAFETLARERQRGRKDNSVLVDRAALGENAVLAQAREVQEVSFPLTSFGMLCSE